LYQDYLYPHVIRLGLLPYSSEQIPAGVPLIGALEGVIERSVVVVAEPRSEWLRSEFGAATRSATRVLMISEQGLSEDVPLRKGNYEYFATPDSEDAWADFSEWFGSWLSQLSRTIRYDV
jgi:hypothetical protein